MQGWADKPVSVQPGLLAEVSQPLPGIWQKPYGKVAN